LLRLNKQLSITNIPAVKLNVRLAQKRTSQLPMPSSGKLSDACISRAASGAQFGCDRDMKQEKNRNENYRDDDPRQLTHFGRPRQGGAYLERRTRGRQYAQRNGADQIEDAECVPQCHRTHDVLIFLRERKR